MESGNSFKKYLWLVKNVLLLVFGLFVGFAICFMLALNRTDKENRVWRFVDQTINSVINQTEFYKDHSTEQGLEGLQKHTKEFSSAYRIFIIDSNLGLYEVVVIFDNAKIFYVDVSIYGDNILLGAIEPGKWTK